MALMPGRSQQSIASKRDVTGLTYIRPNTWNDAEDRKLRQLAETLCATDIAKIMPGRHYEAIRERAKKLGIKLRSRTKPHVMTGDPLIDAIRKRALEDGMSLMALDRELGTKGYFSSGAIAATKRGERNRLDRIAKAVAFFGGELTINWKDE